MPIIDGKALCKRLGTRVLLNNVDVTLVRGEKVGVVGDNGAGKSTLAKILAGLVEADTGQVNRRRGARVAYLEQDPPADVGLTAREVVLTGRPEWLALMQEQEQLSARLGASDAGPGRASYERDLARQTEVLEQLEELGGWGLAAEAERLLDALSLSQHEQRVETMSGGERRRVALARLLFSAPDLAILDEPTNHLDAENIEWLERYLLEEFAGAVLLITHDRWLLDSISDRTWEIAGGSIHTSVGGWQEFLEARAERQEQEQRTEQNRQNFLRKEIEWLRRQPKARSGKQKARIGRAEAAIGAGRPERTHAIDLSLEEERLGGTVLEARDLSVQAGGRCLIAGLNFHLARGSRVGVVGPSGVGKTSLLRTLLGELPPLRGEVLRGKKTKVAYLDQHRSELDENATVMEAITGGNPTVQVGETTYGAHGYLERFRFRGDMVRQKVSGLSGGERARVALAKLLTSPANVLVLDEPTNDLDVMTLGALEELLLGLTGAAMIVSHDRYFLDRVATSVLVLTAERETHHLQGGFSSYLEFKKQRPRANPGGLLQTPAPKAPSAAVSPVLKTPPSARPTVRKLSYAEQQELKRLPGAIEGVSVRLGALQERLCAVDLYANGPDEAARLQQVLGLTQKELEAAETRWLELEERRDAHERASSHPA